MDKDFESWNALKRTINQIKEPVIFKERDIWWCSVGLNIGHEENGKNQFFTRPVLVIKKFNRNMFFGVPLTTKVKENKYYHKICVGGKSGCVMLSQLRVVSSNRLKRRIEELPKRQFCEVKKKLSDIILGENLSPL
jgi:mRNA interferase MazF